MRAAYLSLPALLCLVLVPCSLSANKKRCYECEEGDVSCRDQYTSPLAHDMTCDDWGFNACVKYIYPKSGKDNVKRGCYKVAPGEDITGDGTGCQGFKSNGRKYTKCVCTEGDLCNLEMRAQASFCTLVASVLMSALMYCFY